MLVLFDLKSLKPIQKFYNMKPRKESFTSCFSCGEFPAGSFGCQWRWDESLEKLISSSSLIQSETERGSVLSSGLVSGLSSGLSSGSGSGLGSREAEAGGGSAASWPSKVEVIVSVMELFLKFSEKEEQRWLRNCQRWQLSSALGRKKAIHKS